MSNLLSQASLVMIPSGYKEDVVYSQIPTDGSGDLSFTRASNGTRVNSAGLVEVCPWNLLQYSENFTSGWITVNSSITANSTTAPNGTTTADTFTLTASSDSSIYQPVNGSTNNYSVSIYAKYVSGDKYLYIFSPLNSQSAKVWFDIQNGTVSNQSSGFTGTIENAGNGWYRCSLYNTNQAVLDYIQLGISTTNSSRILSNNSVSYIWGAQINTGALKPYFPTTDRLNVPRLTYQNGGGGCPSLLLEKQSTNLCLQSRNFQTTWTNSNVTITANSTTDVYGTTQAQKIEATGSGVHRCAQFLSTTSGSVYALSIDAKKGSTDWVMIRHDNGGSLNYFNLNTGTKGATCDASALIENVGNGWYRLTVFHTTSSSSGPELYVAKGNNDHDFTANGEYIYIDNVQYEQSSYPTSRIITTSSSATRVADVIGSKSLSSVGITSNYTLFFQLGECNLSAASSWILQGSSGSNTPFQIYGTTAILYTSTGYIYPFSFVSTNPNNSKVAVSYNGTNIKVFLDGVKVGQWTSTSEWANLNDLYLTYNPHQQLQYKQVVLFNVGLSDADGIALTTL